MGRQCTVCAHADLEEINKLLLCSDSYRAIARQFGLSKDALARHKESHIPKELLKSNDIQEIAKADGKTQELTTRYEVQSKGVLKIQPNYRYSYLEGVELQNFVIAVNEYYERINRHLYNKTS